MSSVQVQLSALQDPLHVLASPERCRTTLQDLLAVCRYEEPRQELLQSGGLDVLSGFIASAENSLAGLEILDVLLELLATLACDRNHSTKARLADRPSLLGFPILCLRVLVHKKPAKKRNRSMRIAMELLDQLSFTEPSRRASHQEALLTILLRVLENPEDDGALLQHATEMLSCCMETGRAAIHHAAKFNAISILLRLLNVPSDLMELKRTVCEALLIVASVGELAPIIVANNAIHALAICLRLRALHRHVEAAAVKLLDRLCSETQVFGQVINEDLIPTLFQTVERSTSLDVVRPACRTLEGIVEFARSCKLDLSAFVNTGMPCRGAVLVQAAATHSHDVALVASVFRFFTHAVRNPVALPTLTNSETLEGLLALYIVHCGSAGGRSPNELGAHLVSIVGSLSRSTIENLTLQQDDQSPPALFLCLRGNMADLRFVGNSFAIITKHWGSNTSTAKSAHTLSGFIGIAVEILMQHTLATANASKTELIELYNFLREALLSVDGGETVLACGGVQLYRSLTQRQSKRVDADSDDTSTRSAARSPSPLGSANDHVALQSHFDKIVRTVTDLLGSAMERAVQQTKPACEPHVARRGNALIRSSKPGAVDYSRFVEHMLQREQRSIFIQDDDSHGVLGTARCDVDDEDGGVEALEDERKLGDELHGLPPGAECVKDDQSGDAEDEGDDDANDEPNDDGSDSDGEEDAEMMPSEASVRERWKAPTLQPSEGFTDTDGDDRLRPASRPVPAEATATGRSTPTNREPDAIDQAKLTEKPYCFEDRDGTQLPKHPYRESPRSTTTPAAKAKKTDPLLLLHEPPASPEPCLPADSSVTSAFVDQAMRRRDEFMASDPSTRARVVYENSTVHGNTLEDTGCCPAPNPYAVPAESKAAFASSSSLTFDSAFESGNLERAIQIGEFEYDLVLRRDLNTTGHMQWFYFAVSNTTRSPDTSLRARYRFNIINLSKPDSLFNQGLRPVVYSVKDAHERRVGWRRAGEEIFYYPNPFSRPNKVQAIREAADGKGRGPSPDNNLDSTASNDPVDPTLKHSNSGGGPTFYTLTFTLELTNAEDTYLIAHSYPYTFTDHQRHLQHVLHQHRTGRRRSPQVVKHTVLCSTIAGRPCDLLTITDFSAGTQEIKARRAIVLTARVHPGEAQASWIMRGIIDFLVGGSETARVLRRLFVFRVIPMLNPDGVFYGNSRCSLSACDLNRHWHSPSQQLHPTIFHAKELIRCEVATRGVVFFCDVHGHSRKKNVFMYGCDTKKRPNPRARVFAKVLATQLSAKRFISFADCSFKVSRDKETTARVVLATELKLSWCFTLEASFAGASFGELQNTHFNTAHLRQVGSSLCETLLQASITDVALREKIVSLVDDHAVCLASYVDAHLVDAGIVSDAKSIAQADSVAQTPSGQAPKRAAGLGTGPASKPPVRKDTNLATKTRRRRQSADDDKKTTAATSSSAPKSVRRVVSKRGATSAVTRRRSSPLTSSGTATPEDSDPRADATPAQAASNVAESSVRRRHSSTSCAGGVSRRDLKQQPLLDIIGTFEPPDEEDTQLYKLQSIVRVSSGTSSSSSGASTTTSQPSTPETPPPCHHPPPPAHQGRRITIACPASTRATAQDESSHASLFGFGLRDSVPVILPPPVSDLLLTRSPKPPSKNIRFRGAGRQYAAVSPAAKPTTHTTELLQKNGSLASIAPTGYEADLINASTISLKHRSSNGSDQMSPPPRLQKLHSSPSSVSTSTRSLGRLGVL